MSQKWNGQRELVVQKFKPIYRNSDVNEHFETLTNVSLKALTNFLTKVSRCSKGNNWLIVSSPTIFLANIFHRKDFEFLTKLQVQKVKLAKILYLSFKTFT